MVKGMPTFGKRMQSVMLAFLESKVGCHFLPIIGGELGDYNLLSVIFVDLWILHLGDVNISYFH